MKKIDTFISLLNSVLDFAEKEKEIMLDKKMSRWSLDQIQNTIIFEISELLSYAKNGKIYFKYGKKQRLLESSYLITDSLNDFSHTSLGESIFNLQKFYDLL